MYPLEIPGVRNSFYSRISKKFPKLELSPLDSAPFFKGQYPLVPTLKGPFKPGSLPIQTGGEFQNSNGLLSNFGKRWTDFFNSLYVELDGWFFLTLLIGFSSIPLWGFINPEWSVGLFLSLSCGLYLGLSWALAPFHEISEGLSPFDPFFGWFWIASQWMGGWALMRLITLPFWN